MPWLKLDLASVAAIRIVVSMAGTVKRGRAVRPHLNAFGA
jgi:hypothetical protein